MLTPLAEEVHASFSPLKSAPNMLMLGGLVVTLWGLAHTIGNLPFQDDTLDIQRLTDALPKALAEMKGAFYGSLIGVGWAVVLGLFVAETQRRSQKLLAKIADVGHMYLAPIILKPKAEKQVEELRDAIKKTQDFFEDLRDKFKEVTDIFGQEIKNAGLVMHKTLESLEESTEAIKSTLEEASGKVAEGAKDLADSTQTLRNLHFDMRSAYTSLEKMFQTGREDLEDMSKKQIAALLQVQNRFSDGAQNILSQLMQNSATMTSFSEKMDQNREATFQSGNQISQSVSTSFDHLHDRLEGTLKTYTHEVDELGVRMQAMTSRIEDLSKSSLDVLRLSADMQAQERLRHDELLKALSAQNQSLSALQHTLEDQSPLDHFKDQKVYQTAALSGLIEQQERMMSVIQQASDGLGTQLHLDLQKTQDVLSALQTVVPERQQVYQWIAQSGDQLQDQLEHYTLSLQGQLRKTQKDLQDLRAEVVSTLAHRGNGHSAQQPAQIGPFTPSNPTVKLEKGPGDP
ncbi:hypothetical protein [Deinococcus misasensis]|uniref:hypothetical protein n=1 Tax=Deinococcus misasensis TaxID=392413 RepID=UPI0012FC6494|nr:hypothetical protein [Deinococcus misasensis]